MVSFPICIFHVSLTRLTGDPQIHPSSPVRPDANADELFVGWLDKGLWTWKPTRSDTIGRFHEQ